VGFNRSISIPKKGIFLMVRRFLLIGDIDISYNIQIVDIITNPIYFTEFMIELKDINEELIVLSWLFSSEILGFEP
jgi:hypothetical protein